MSRFFWFLLQLFPLLPCLGSQFRAGRAPELGTASTLQDTFSCSLPVPFPLAPNCFSNRSTCQAVLSESPPLHSQPRIFSLTALSTPPALEVLSHASLCWGCWCQVSEHSTALHQLCALVVSKWGPWAEIRRIPSLDCFRY